MLFLVIFNVLIGWAMFEVQSQPSFPKTCNQKPFEHCSPVSNDAINVHLISHSHLDLGWIKTVEEYYHGPNLFFDLPGSVVKELRVNKTRKFAFAETGFFWMWWKEQSEETKAVVRSLVSQGRLEFVMGAWGSNDEAITYYSDIIDQHTLGLKFLNEEFGPCARPRVGWQLDTFGHSREFASLLSQMGYDAVFLGRFDLQEKENRKRQKTKEFLWQPNRNLPENMFSSITPNTLSPPDGFCWRWNCKDEDISEVPIEKLEDRMVQFANLVYKLSDEYKTNHVYMTFGDDFSHYNADRWYNNLDKIIKNMATRSEKLSQKFSRPKINVLHSTPNCYIYSLNQNNHTTWKIEKDDFVKYAFFPTTFFSGFYTSRPALKFNVRQTGSFLRATRQLAALARLGDSSTSELIATLERTMAIMQHHDAITGTENTRVAQDYIQKMWSGLEAGLTVVQNALSQLAQQQSENQTSSPKPEISFCSLLNQTECKATELVESFKMVVYNPLARKVRWWTDIPVVGYEYQVVDLDKQTLVSFDLVPIYPEIKLIAGRQSNASHRLIFGLDLPAMGFKVLKISKIGSLLGSNDRSILRNPSQQSFWVRNEHLVLKFDSSGNLAQAKNLNDQTEIKINQSFCYWTASSHPKKNSDHPSGAYIFRPDPAKGLICFKVKKFSVNRMGHVTEVHQVFNSWISQTVRLFQDAKHVEFNWQIGPIDVTDKTGKEVIMKFTTDIQSGDVFYTDSNGRQTVKRNRSSRSPLEPEASNYYPVTTTIFIQGRQKNTKNKSQLTLVTDRGQGGSSMSPGSVELMLHRRLLLDDQYGMDEPLNEVGPDGKGLVVNGVVSMVLADATRSASLYRQLALELNNRPLVVFSNDSQDSQLDRLLNLNMLESQLPPNLHLLTLTLEHSSKNEAPKSLLLRLEHFFETGEDSNMSNAVSVDIKKIFKPIFDIQEVEELALGGNMGVEELDKRLKWKSDDGKLWPIKKENQDKPQEFLFSFSPMQIR